MRKTIALLSTFMIILCLTSCGTAQLREDASAAVDTYNQAVAAYNTGIQPYNEAVGRIESANEGLLSVVNAAQDVINQGETPYDPSTLEQLKAAMADAGEAKASVPPLLEEYEMLAVPEDAKKADLESLIEQATTGTESLSAVAIPDTPSVPDYSNVSAAVTDAQRTYEDSIQSLKQITAPEDSFVMERLQRVDTITAMDAVTEDHDPNGQLTTVVFTDHGDTGTLLMKDGRAQQCDVVSLGYAEEEPTIPKFFHATFSYQQMGDETIIYRTENQKQEQIGSLFYENGRISRIKSDGKEQTFMYNLEGRAFTQDGTEIYPPLAIFFSETPTLPRKHQVIKKDAKGRLLEAKASMESETYGGNVTYHILYW